MNSAGPGMQKEIPIHRQEIGHKSDIFMLSEDVRWQDCLNHYWYMLRFDASALSLEDHYYERNYWRLTFRFPFAKGTPIVVLDCVLYPLMLLVVECALIYNILQFGCL